MSAETSEITGSLGKFYLNWQHDKYKGKNGATIQAQDIWNDHIDPLLNEGKSVGLLYSANNEQVVAITESYSRNEVPKLQGENQAALFREILNLIYDKMKQNPKKYGNLNERVRILPIATSMVPGGNDTFEKCVKWIYIKRDLDNIEDYIKKGYHVIGLAEKNKVGNPFSIGSGVSKQWNLTDVAALVKKSDGTWKDVDCANRACEVGDEVGEEISQGEYVQQELERLLKKYPAKEKEDSDIATKTTPPKNKRKPKPTPPKSTPPEKAKKITNPDEETTISLKKYHELTNEDNRLAEEIKKKKELLKKNQFADPAKPEKNKEVVAQLESNIKQLEAEIDKNEIELNKQIVFVNKYPEHGKEESFKIPKDGTEVKVIHHGKRPNGGGGKFTFESIVSKDKVITKSEPSDEDPSTVFDVLNQAGANGFPPIKITARTPLHRAYAEHYIRKMEEYDICGKGTFELSTTGNTVDEKLTPIKQQEMEKRHDAFMRRHYSEIDLSKTPSFPKPK